MVPSRCVKSEYMKCYKEPKWEACGPCYQELLRYRLSRRLLEQAHRPWFWDDWDQDSSSGGGGSGNGNGSGGSPSPLGTSSPPAAQQREEEAAATAEAPGQPDPGRHDGSGETRRAGPPEPLRGSEEEEQEKAEEKAEIKKAEKKSVGKERNNNCQVGQSPSRSALASRGDRRQAKSPQRTEAPKGTKHPFALYGWGEKQTDTGSQKTHNVCASASANEIHESALRAKNRRQVEKRKLSQRRIHSAEVERTWRTKSSGPDNPWMTEYMRCYSARAR